MSKDIYKGESIRHSDWLDGMKDKEPQMTRSLPVQGMTITERSWGERKGK